MLNADVGIDFGRVQACVAKQDLQHPYIGASFQHMRGHGVAQQVCGAWLIDAREAHVPFHVSGNELRTDGFAVVCQK